MVGWHHLLDRHEFEQVSGDGKDREDWRASTHGFAESDTTEPLNNNKNRHPVKICWVTACKKLISKVWAWHSCSHGDAREGEQWIELERERGLDPRMTCSHGKKLVHHPRAVNRPLKDCKPKSIFGWISPF